MQLTKFSDVIFRNSFFLVTKLLTSKVSKFIIGPISMALTLTGTKDCRQQTQLLVYDRANYFALKIPCIVLVQFGRQSKSYYSVWLGFGKILWLGLFLVPAIMAIAFQPTFQHFIKKSSSLFFSNRLHFPGY